MAAPPVLRSHRRAAARGRLRCLAADPELARAHLGLGRVLSSAGLRRSARLAYERAYALDPSDRSVWWAFAVTRSDPVARRMLTELLERTREPDARAGLERTIAHRAALDGRKACRSDPPRAVEISSRSRPAISVSTSSSAAARRS